MNKISQFKLKIARWLFENQRSRLADGLLQLSENELTTIDRQTGLFVVVPRPYYQEFHRDYPIENKSELKKVLTLEYDNSMHVSHFIGNAQANVRRVTSYVYEPAIFNQISRSCVLLPESYLLAKSLHKGQAAIVRQRSGTYFISNMLGHLSSLRQSGLCPDLSAYLLYSGFAADSAAINISTDDDGRYLFEGFSQLTFAEVVAFFQRSKHIGSRINFKPLLLSAAVLGLVYSALSTGYLLWAQHTRSEIVEEMGSDLDRILLLQQNLERGSMEAQAYQKEFADNIDTAQIWFVVAALLSQADTSIQSFSFSNGTFELRGSAPKATDVLQTIARLPYFSDVKFVSPVSKQRKVETFTISASLTFGLNHAIATKN